MSNSNELIQRGKTRHKYNLFQRSTHLFRVVNQMIKVNLMPHIVINVE